MANKKFHIVIACETSTQGKNLHKNIDLILAPFRTSPILTEPSLPSYNAEALMRAELVVNEVKTGDEALRIANSAQVSLMISGRNLADMKGVDLLRFTRASSEQTHLLPFILTSESKDKMEFIEALERGVSEYLLIPWSLETLEQSIRNALSRKESDIIKWSSSFSVSVPKIDDQHKTLVHLINSLHAAIIAGQGREKVGWVLERLVDYTEEHFQYEESFMQSISYPNLENHKQEHVNLIEQVSELSKSTSVPEPAVGVTLASLQFLKNWLTDHIMGSDMLYAQHARSC